MKRAFAVKSFTMTMMAVLLLCAMVLCGGGAKAADNEAKTIEIHPGDEFLIICNDYYMLNTMEHHEWTGGYIITGTNVDGQGQSTLFQIAFADGYNGKDRGSSITISDLTIDDNQYTDKCACSLNGSAKVDLQLEGRNLINSGENQAGIQAASETGSLTLGGSGCLDVKGGRNGAGIGGGSGQDGLNITINSGIINATGKAGGAGIGGGYNCSRYTLVGNTNYRSSYGGDGKNITINGGCVTATGEDEGAGIGGAGRGIFSLSGGTGENITINGGIVNAASRGSGAGIGGGSLGNGKSLTINGGTVTASTGGKNSDDIGGGKLTIASHNGPLQVTGGSVNADLYKNDDPKPYNNTTQVGSSLTHYTLTLKDGSGQAAADNSVEELHIGVYSGVKGLAGANDTSHYSIQDMKTNSDGQLSLYMDQTSIPNGSTVTVVAGDVTYTGVLYGCSMDLMSTGTLSLQDGTHLTIWNDGYYLGAETDPSESQKNLFSGDYAINGKAEGQTDCSITVKNGAADKNIVISDLNIDNSGYSEAPFVIENNASVNLTGMGSNTLRAGDGKAGLQVSEAGSVAIDGTGSLKTYGGNSGAGIGGADAMTSGNITINSADVTAVGGTDAAGIGGGSHGAVTRIILNSGTVTAAGGEAGIGLGRGSYFSGSITVNSDVTLACVSGMRYGVTPLNNNVYQQPVAQFNFTEQQTAGKVISLSDSISLAPVSDYQSVACTVEAGSCSVLLDGNQQGYDSGKETTFTIGSRLTSFNSIKNCVSTEKTEASQADALPAETVPADTAPAEDVNAADTAAEDAQNTAAEAGSEESSVQTDSTDAAVSETVETPAA